MNKPNKIRNQTIINWLAWGMVLAFIITFSVLAIARHRAFLSGFDLGVYNQVVWNTLHGRLFFYTSTGEPLLHLSNHADPILLLFAPLYLLHSGPETLLVLQAALIGLAGLPVFWLGREKLNAFAGLSLLAAYLLFPGTEVITLSDFHPPAMAFAFLMFAFYFLEKRKVAPFFIFAVLAMACKEQIPLQVIFLGLYALIRHRDWRLGLSTMVLGAAWFVVVMYWVIPAFSVISDHIFLHFYAEFGDSPAEIVLTVITRPDLVIKNLLQPLKLAYLRDVFVPFGLLSLAGLPVLLVGLPSFAINLLSANEAMFTATRGHYVADVIPWLIWSALFGILFLSKGAGRIWPRLKNGSVIVLSVALLAISLGWHLFNGLSPLSINAPRWDVTAHDRLGEERFVAQIPPDAAVSVQGKLYSHLSHRRIAYVFPHVFEANTILLDVTSDTSPLHPNNYRDEMNALLQSGDWGILDAADGYILLKRGESQTTLPDSFFDFARDANPTPQYPLDVQFGDDLALLGYDVLDEPLRRETSVRLYWRALKPIDDDLRLYPFFLNPNGDIIEDTSLRPLMTQLWYPPRMWQPGEVVVSQTLAWALGDDWSLAVGVLAGDDWTQWNQRLPVTVGESSAGLRRFETATWVRLGAFQRQGQELTKIAPADSDLVPPNVAQFNLDNKMGLLGYGFSQTGQTLDVTLYWQSLAQMGYDYTVFVHLIDAQGNTIAQHDGHPWWDVSIPTTTWLPGEKLRDRHSLELPPDLPPGAYTLRVGAYYWQTLERLPVLNESGAAVGDSVELSIEITP